MASSLLKGCACALGAVVAFAVAAQVADSHEDLVLKFESFSYDGGTNLVRLMGPRIVQGETEIAADAAVATGIEFDERSEWRFTGNVQITVGTAVMRADSAVFVFDNEELATGELTGSPATFEDANPDGEHPISGTAGTIAYDSAAGTLRLTQNPRLVRDRIEASGCDLIYDFAADGFRSGTSNCPEQNNFRVLPKTDDPAPTPAPPE